jgi:DNA-binding transcriptional LysR family regulator
MLDKLEFMIALARERHFGRAAESCGVAQPTFSQGIQQLEETLNVPLVKRSSRFLGFTPEGERVLVWARRLVGDVHAMRQEIQQMQHGLGPNVRIAAMPIIASLTTPFQICHPAVRFTLITRTADEIIKLLHEREIDLGCVTSMVSRRMRWKRSLFIERSIFCLPGSMARLVGVIA